MCNRLIQAILPFIGFLCPLPSTAVHVITRGGRHPLMGRVYTSNILGSPKVKTIVLTQRRCMTKKRQSSANLRPLYSGDTWVLD